MALAQHFIAHNGFNPVNIPLTTDALVEEDSLLAKEAFPGELASLRAQLLQSKLLQKQPLKNQVMQHKLSQDKK